MGFPTFPPWISAKIPSQVWQKHLAKRCGSAVSCWRQKFGMTRLVNFAKFRDVCCNWDRSKKRLVELQGKLDGCWLMVPPSSKLVYDGL